MRQLSCIVVFVSMIGTDAFAGVRKIHPGVSPITSTATVDPRESAGLFVGIRDFNDETLTAVKYAVDDAVDLAFELAVERRPPLLQPARVALALSGEPQKRQSQEKLKTLLAAGATRHSADQSEILNLLRRQSGLGKNGLVVVAFATHGISEDGAQYLLAATSLLDYRETMLTEGRICDVVSSSGAERSLILIDACRERLTPDRRNPEVDPRSVAGFLAALSSVDGQAVLSAAAAGGYAYDDDIRHNGVFTSAVIDGLKCGAGHDGRGFVTVDALATFVEEQVLTWIRAHKNPEARKATQARYEGHSKMMPLAICVTRSGLASERRPE